VARGTLELDHRDPRLGAGAGWDEQAQTDERDEPARERRAGRSPPPCHGSTFQRTCDLYAKPLDPSGAIEK
jgi:hypothetical protein